VEWSKEEVTSEAGLILGVRGAPLRGGSGGAERREEVSVTGDPLQPLYLMGTTPTLFARLLFTSHRLLAKHNLFAYHFHSLWVG